MVGFDRMAGNIIVVLLQRVFDRFQRTLNFLWSYEGLFSFEEFSNRMKEEASLRKLSYDQMVIGYVENIESKSEALLTHVSVMIALTGVYFAFSEHSFLLAMLLGAEIVGYIWAALCCLRCLMQLSTVDFLQHPEGTWIEGIELEGFKRELIYRHALQILVFFTMMLVVTVLLHSGLNLI